MKKNHHSDHMTGRVHESIQDKFSTILHYLEFCLATISVVVVILGTIQLLREIPNLGKIIDEGGLYQGLEELFSDILLLVVGVELAIMLVHRKPENLVEVIFFVLARRMLIKTESFYELSVGVAALAGLFAIRKYLVGHREASKSETTQ